MWAAGVGHIRQAHSGVGLRELGIAVESDLVYDKSHRHGPTLLATEINCSEAATFVRYSPPVRAYCCCLSDSC